jgi:hypothetical protein
MHGQMVPPSSASADNQSQPTSAVYEDPLEVQKKIMRQTRELAIKRRQEEEAKEEAARKERIRIKLEAMGPPPETKKKSSPQEAKVTPTQIQTVNLRMLSLGKVRRLRLKVVRHRRRPLMRPASHQ